MYELVILMFLMRGPMHGYLIASILNDIIGPFAKVSHGRLYPLLAQLETRGLIIAAERGRSEKPHDRRQRTYQITAAGQERFHELMLDTTSNLGDYQALFWMKIQVLEFLSPSERLYVIDHYLNYCQTHVFYLTGQMEQLERDAAQQQFMSPDQLVATLYAMERYRRQWQLEIELVREWRQREVQRAEGEQSQETSHNAVPAPD
ncbi:MAG TPA: PadR family transcriptional regulator [Ktedonobacterales bacterium]|nr:PadR family transcriptional regulator [Ktedonobacterales bacterium]